MRPETGGSATAQRSELRPDTLARWCLGAGIAATIGANLAHGLGRGPSVHWSAPGARPDSTLTTVAGPGRAPVEPTQTARSICSGVRLTVR